MKPSLETYTAALPWYERADFARLWQLAHDQNEMPVAYDEWLQAAESTLRAALAAGQAIQVITIRPEPFLDWLQARPNTAAERRRYVELVATNAIHRAGRTVVERRTS